MSPHLLVLLWALILSQFTIGYAEKKLPKVGEKCDQRCGGEHTICNHTLRNCQCHSDYPIEVPTRLGTLCVKPAKLGEDCLGGKVCLSEDVNSDCVQNDHLMRAICVCKDKFDIVYDKGMGKDRCVRAQLINSDLATLLGVGAGMTLFCGLTCLVLRMFARARFGTRRDRYANAQNPPPITLSTDQGETRGHSQSRNSSQRSSLAESSRRQSGSLLAPPSRPGEGGSRRASNSSIRSTSSSRSQRSYSLRNPAHHNHFNHTALQHRPSDPESRSQTSQLSVHNRTSQDNVSGGSGNSVTFAIPNSSSNSSTNQSQPGATASTSPHQIQKGKRSGSAGTLPV